MKSRHLVLVIIGVILCVSTIVPVSPVEANPIGIAETPTGAVLSTSNNLTMPMASVDIHDTPSRVNESTFYHNITIYGVYTIKSISDVETLLAFAYPITWDLGWESEILSRDLTIFVNRTNTEYEVVTSEEYLGEVDYDHYLYDWIQFGQLHFATFPLSMEANETYILEVIGYIDAIARVEDFIFSYCVGTGRTWAGHTQEVIRFTIESYTEFLDCSFYPNASLTEAVVDGNLVGEWDLNLTEFEFNYIKATCTHFDRYVRDMQSQLESTLITIFGVGILVILVLFYTKISSSQEF